MKRSDEGIKGSRSSCVHMKTVVSVKREFGREGGRGRGLGVAMQGVYSVLILGQT